MYNTDLIRFLTSFTIFTNHLNHQLEAIQGLSFQRQLTRLFLFLFCFKMD